MRSIILSVFFTALACRPHSPAQEYRLQPLPISAVTIDDAFWAPRIERNRAVTIPHILKQNELTGRVANFVKAAHQMSGAYNANLVNKDFGPAARHAAPGHEEIELALIKLYRTTGNRDYANLAKFFLDQRGKPHDIEDYPAGAFAMYNDRPYKQDHLRVVEQDKAVGHAVRAVYLYSGMTDVAAIFNDSSYKRAIERIWTDMTSKRMYLTGGIGARSGTEAFGDDYELPNRRAYTETCASIGNVLWNHRMFLLEGDGRYLDAAEQILYNGFLSGVSLSGDKFFYQNPLESEGNNERSTYFDVACCPANLARAMAQFPGLVYAQSNEDLYVNLYVKSRAANTLLTISQETQYPWTGDIRINMDPAKPVDLNLHVRIPGWARGQLLEGDLYRIAVPPVQSPTVHVNGKLLTPNVTKGFVEIQRKWKKGDVVTIHLPMPVQRVVANDRLVANNGRAAIQRGPILYCAEGIDNSGQATQLEVPLNAKLEHSFRPDLLGGVEIVTGNMKGSPFTAIPYSLWANRGRGGMAVWLKN